MSYLPRALGSAGGNHHGSARQDLGDHERCSIEGWLGRGSLHVHQEVRDGLALLIILPDGHDPGSHTRRPGFKVIRLFPTSS